MDVLGKHIKYKKAIKLYRLKLTDKEVAKKLGVKECAVRRWRKRNNLPSISRTGKGYLKDIGRFTRKDYASKSSFSCAVSRDGRKRLEDPSICPNCWRVNDLDLCHIKAVSSFPEEATIAEINKKDNLIYLCKTCHWELDQGSLTIEQIRKNDINNFWDI